MLDTGASCSILRKSLLNKNALILSELKVNIKGISNKIVPTLGLVYGTLKIARKNIMADFQVINDVDFPTNYDCIIGMNLLKNSIINNVSNVLEIENCKIPMLDYDDAQHICEKINSEKTYNLNLIQKKDLVKENNIFKVFNYNELNNVVSENTENIQTINRFELIKSEINLSHLDDSKSKDILNLIEEFSNIFHLKSEKLTVTNTIVHEIPTLMDKPVFVKPYRIPTVLTDECNKILKELIKNDCITPSTSSYNSPMFLIPKKDYLPNNDLIENKEHKKIQPQRLVIDYRLLNKQTEVQKYPSPNIDEILHSIGKSKYYTCVDCTQSFHQILIAPQDRHKTAFSTPYGKWEWKKMPFGLSGAPITFQKLMDTILCGLQGLELFCYMDDIVVHSETFAQHLYKLRKLFEILRKHNIKLQPGKTQFFKSELNFLGFIINENGYKVDARKICAVKNFKQPVKMVQVQSFLGLTNYFRKFIPKYSDIIEPLINLTRKNVQFKWNEKCESSFEQLKNVLISEPILTFPDMTLPYIVQCDASNYAIGGILMQYVDGKNKVIAYGSRVLSLTEKNYSIYDREALAVYYCICEVFKPYIYNKSVIVQSDQQALITLMNAQLGKNTPRITRWKIELQSVVPDLKIVHIAGKLNLSDVLSRIVSSDAQCIIVQNKNDLNFPKIEYINVKPDNKSLNQNISCVNLITRSSAKAVEQESKVEFFKFQQLLNENKIKLQNNVSVVQSKIEDLLQVKVYFIEENLNSLPKNLVDLVHKSRNKEKIFMIKDCIFVVYKSNSQEKTTKENIFYFLQQLFKFVNNNNLSEIAILGINEISIPNFMFNLMISYVFTNINVIICEDSVEEILDIDKKNKIIEYYHDSPIGGHGGLKKTYRRIKAKYSWKGLKKDVQNYIKTCLKCQLNKNKRKTKIPLKITSYSENVFQRLYIDIVGPIIATENSNCYILTMMDELTRYLVAVPLKKIDAITVADALVNNFILVYGAPKEILSDQGSQFMSQVFKNVCKLFKIKKINCSAYHPASNGALERVHRTINNIIKNNII